MPHWIESHTRFVDSPRNAQADAAAPPFSFTCGGEPAAAVLARCEREDSGLLREDGQLRRHIRWFDPATKLRIEWTLVYHEVGPRSVIDRAQDKPATQQPTSRAVDWILHIENTGDKPTPILEDIQPLDITIAEPLREKVPCVLHRTNGAPSNPTDFEARAVDVTPHTPQEMSAGGGRSSNRDFPFFKLETGIGSIVVAVGWSGQWKSVIECPDESTTHITAGMELTHFKLLPGERVRTPRILMLHHDGDALEANARFRRLIYDRYCARRDGKQLLPTLYCNTCFTRGGGWLNECNEQNQISLIRAYAPLNLEALLTDAGWFEGGWPAGAGNWTPRKDAYPDGMAPVAAEAKKHGMIYGLWFEPERVVAGTDLHRHHPKWLLASRDQPESTYLLNFGLPEVRDHFFDIVKGFMALPGFRVYRQDFNMDPLPYWRHNDAPDRQGITEIRYIEGLYAYWERIARTWPDSLRIECSSGGRRIDLETVMRMHVHQKSDYWFHNEVDQASIWGLSQYLPNNVFMAPINRMDDYSFHSAMATSLCMGWIADADDFDVDRGRKLLDRYVAVRHLLIGAWYPLLGYSRDDSVWMAAQYHRPDLDEGMILVFRRAASPYPAVEVALHDLDPTSRYTLTSDRTGESSTLTGAELMRTCTIKLPDPHQSDLIVYKRAEDR